MEIIIITGMSGSGKSYALDVFEDLGYYAMDNLAPALLPKFCNIALDAKSKNFEKVAAVVDMRSGELFNDFYSAYEELKGMNLKNQALVPLCRYGNYYCKVQGTEKASPNEQVHC